MKRFAVVLVGLVILIAAVSASAQMAPTPAPELKKLDYFAGTWNIDSTIAPGPWGAGGKFTATGSEEWQQGNFFLVGHDTFSMPAELGGSGTGLTVMLYDADKKVYTEERFDSRGQHQKSAGTLNGDTWTWTSENNYGGMTIQGKLTLKILSPTSYSTKYEVSADGGSSWMPFWDGKATKK